MPQFGPLFNLNYNAPESDRGGPLTKWSFYILTFLTTVTVVQAGPRFQDVRLDRKNYSMYLVPVTHQHGPPLCFAFAATQMVDAYRSSLYQKDLAERGEKKSQSEMQQELPPSSAFATAVWTGYETGLSYEQTLNSGGFLCEAMNSLLKQGHCEAQKTQGLFAGLKAFPRTENERQQDLMAGNKFLTENKIYKSPVVEELFAGHAQELQNGHHSDPRLAILKQQVDQSCDPTEDLSYLKLTCQEIRRKGPRPERGDLLIEQINKELDKGTGALPIGIKYCANFLDKGPEYQAAYPVQREGSDKAEWVWRQDCLVHYSLIIGRRSQNLPSPQYLIRDSYGTDCGGSSLHPAFVCEQGNIWVEEEMIKSNLLEIDLLLPPE